MKKTIGKFPYLHGFSQLEQDRLKRQASFAEYTVYQNINFSETKNLLEVGCGVGAQSEILLRRYPHINLTGIDLNDKQITAAKDSLESFSHLNDRWNIQKMDAGDMKFDSDSFDGAFVCWVLEHVPKPTQVLAEIRRVLKTGSRVYITEVMNHTFFLDPYSPNVWKYWQAYNDYQYDQAGDPFIGAKLGNLLSQAGFKDVQTTPINWFLDNRHPSKRKEIIDFWTDLLLSGADQLIKAKYISQQVVDNAKKELEKVSKDPNAVFMFSMMQAHATVL